MRCLSTLLCLALLTAASPSPAAPATQPSREQLAQIYALVEDLMDVDVRKREAAQEALIEMGEIVRSPLEMVLRKNDHPEARSRIERILMRCQGGGDIVNGLQITLRTNSKIVRVGESFMLTSEIKNTTDKPVNLYVGYSTGGPDFLSGSALRVVNAPHGFATGRWLVGFCGTGAGPLFRTIAPGATISYELPAALAKNDAQLGRGAPNQAVTEHVLLLSASKYMVLPVQAKEGAHVFRIEHGVTEEMNVRRGFERGDGQRPTDEKARFWTGQIVSNEIQVKLHVP